MTSDEDRLQRYLEWQHARERERARWRRRVFGYVGAPALCVLALGVAVWLARPWIDPAQPVTAITTPEPRARATEPPRAAPESRESEAIISAPAPEPPAVEAPEPPARPRPRAAPSIASRARIRPGAPTPPIPAERSAVPAPAPSSEAATESEVAAAIASPPAPAPETPRIEIPAEPSEVPSQSLPAPNDVVAVPPHPEDAVQAAPEVSLPPSGGAVAIAPPTPRERMTRWAKGEVQEFRDGVKRELRGFRSGYDKVRDFFRR